MKVTRTARPGFLAFALLITLASMGLIGCQDRPLVDLLFGATGADAARPVPIDDQQAEAEAIKAHLRNMIEGLDMEVVAEDERHPGEHASLVRHENYPGVQLRLYRRNDDEVTFGDVGGVIIPTEGGTPLLRIHELVRQHIGDERYELRDIATNGDITIVIIALRPGGFETWSNQVFLLHEGQLQRVDAFGDAMPQLMTVDANGGRMFMAGVRFYGRDFFGSVHFYEVLQPEEGGVQIHQRWITRSVRLEDGRERPISDVRLVVRRDGTPFVAGFMDTETFGVLDHDTGETIRIMREDDSERRWLEAGADGIVHMQYVRNPFVGLDVTLEDGPNHVLELPFWRQWVYDAMPGSVGDYMAIVNDVNPREAGALLYNIWPDGSIFSTPLPSRESSRRIDLGSGTIANCTMLFLYTLADNGEGQAQPLALVEGYCTYGENPGQPALDPADGQMNYIAVARPQPLHFAWRQVNR